MRYWSFLESDFRIISGSLQPYFYCILLVLLCEVSSSLAFSPLGSSRSLISLTPPFVIISSLHCGDNIPLKRKEESLPEIRQYDPKFTQRLEAKLTPGNIPIVSRTVSISGSDDDDYAGIPNVVIWELKEPSVSINAWCIDEPDDTVSDPFGVVAWPGSVTASRELIKCGDNGIRNTTVLVLGAGTGVEAQVAALMGASRVIATDANELTLRLLRHGAEMAGLDCIIECKVFDLFSGEKLPDCDIVVAADLMYSKEIAKQLFRRCIEFLNRPHPVGTSKLIVTDSQRFHGTDFLRDIQEQTDHTQATWVEQSLQNFTGSGVAIEEDQTYNVKTRLLKIG